MHCLGYDNDSFFVAIALERLPVPRVCGNFVGELVRSSRSFPPIRPCYSMEAGAHGSIEELIEKRCTEVRNEGELKCPEFPKILLAYS